MVTSVADVMVEVLAPVVVTSNSWPLLVVLVTMVKEVTEVNVLDEVLVMGVWTLEEDEVVGLGSSEDSVVVGGGCEVVRGVLG